MQPMHSEGADLIEMTYRFEAAGREQRLWAVARTPPAMPLPESVAYRLMDRNWRYGTTRNGELLRTCVEGAVPPVYHVEEHHVTMQ